MADRGQARLLGVRILALTQQARIAKDSAMAADRLFGAVSNAAGRGDLAAGDLDTRRQAALDTADKARLAERDLTAARGDLNALLGLPPETMLLLAPADSSPAPTPAAMLTAQAVDRRLDLQALRQGYAASEAELRKQVLDQFPTLSLQLAGARDTAANYTTGPTVGFTLPAWNRNRGGIAIATATRAQLKAEYEARLFQTRADIGKAVEVLAVIWLQRAELIEKLPALDRYADATKRAAARGDLAPATADTAAQAIRDRRLTLSQIDQQIAEQRLRSDGLVANTDVETAKAAAVTVRATQANLGLSAGGTTLRAHLGTLFDAASRQFMVGPSIDLPIFQGGRLTGTLELRRSQQRDAALQFRKVVLQSWHDVDDAMVAYAEAQHTRVAAAGTRDADIRAVDAADQRYAQGLTSLLDVIAAQEGVLRGETAIAQA